MPPEAHRPHPVALAPGAHHAGARPRPRATRPPRPARRAAASTSQAPNAHVARHGQLHRLGRRLGSSRAGTNRSVPYSATACRPPPRSSDLVPSPPRAMTSSASRRESGRGPRPRLSASRRSTSRRSAGGQLLERRRAAPRGRRRAPRARPPAAMSSTSASSRSWRAVSAIVSSAFGLSCLQRRARTSCRTRARAKRASAFDGSSRHWRSRAPQVLAHLLARHLEQRPHQPPAPRLHAPERAAARATRPAGRAPSRPGRWRCAPRRSPRSWRPRPARSAPRAPRPGGCRTAGSSTCSTVSGTPSRSQSRRQNSSSPSAVGRSP